MVHESTAIADTPRTVVLGIGNTLLRDDGAGIHVLEALRGSGLPAAWRTTCLDGGTLSFALLAEIEPHDRLIVIDAAQVDSTPGTVQVFEGEDMDRFLGTRRRQSVHEVGLLDLLRVACLTDALPALRALVAIQPESIEWGDTPTAVVAAAIPKACVTTLDLIRRWQL
jgi:hydrogenase maturation protease